LLPMAFRSCAFVNAWLSTWLFWVLWFTLEGCCLGRKECTKLAWEYVPDDVCGSACSGWFALTRTTLSPYDADSESMCVCGTRSSSSRSLALLWLVCPACACVKPNKWSVCSVSMLKRYPPTMRLESSHEKPAERYTDSGMRCRNTSPRSIPACSVCVCVCQEVCAFAWLVYTCVRPVCIRTVCVHAYSHGVCIRTVCVHVYSHGVCTCVFARCVYSHGVCTCVFARCVSSELLLRGDAKELPREDEKWRWMRSRPTHLNMNEWAVHAADPVAFQLCMYVCVCIRAHGLTANALAKLKWLTSCFTDVPRFDTKKGTSVSAPMRDITAPIRAPKKENPQTCSEE
jgi:hypothetical protein